MVKVPQHTIRSSTVRTVASEELQAEVEQELQAAQASPQEDTPDIADILASADEDTEEDEN